MKIAAVDGQGSYPLTALQPQPVLLLDALHDIAQPLTILAALLDEAGQAAEPALSGDYLAMACGACHRAVAAVRSLQMLSAIHAAGGDVEGLY